MMETETEQLVIEARQGSREALEEVLRRIQGPVYGLALRMLFLPADAEDATQEILIKVITNLQGFRFEGSFKGWVMRIAANHLKTIRKTWLERKEMTMDKAQAIIDRAEAKGWFAKPLEAPAPLLEVEMRTACTQALLLVLDRPHRMAFILGVIMEVSGREGAFILDITPAAFRKRISRARAKVNDFLSANCGLFSESNPCQCGGLAIGHIMGGWIDPDKPLFVSTTDEPENPVALREYLMELDELGRVAALYKSFPPQKCTTDFAAMIKKLIEENKYRVLSDPRAAIKTRTGNRNQDPFGDKNRRADEVKENVMSGNVYRKLQEQLDQYSVGFPASESGLDIQMLEKLFTEEEAELFLYLTMNLETPEAVAQRTGRNPDETATLLENMAEKGLVFRYRKNELKKYGAAPFVLGIYEYQLNRLDSEFARLFEDYLHDSFHKVLAGPQTLLRPIPINRSVDADLQVAAYEDAQEILKKQKKIAIADCICQVQQDLIGQGCDKPREVCFMFGSTAQYFIDRGMGRQIEVDEAMRILDKCQEAGLVIQPASAQNPGGMCNCCGDCCGLLRAIKKFPQPAELVLSNYYAEVDQDECTACEVCLDRCQMDAVTVADAAEINLDRCIGCGLCVTTCPTSAIHMIRKPDDQVITPPATGVEIMMDLAKARGTELVPLALLKQ